MKQRTLQTLYSYWNELRAGRLAPRRLEIEPSRIASILAETFMLDRSEEGVWQFRLAGTRLCELFGSELRGADFLQGWDGDDRLVIERQLASICEQGGAGLLTIEIGFDNRHRLELEAILLPLLHSGETVGRIIGAMSTSSFSRWQHTDSPVTRRLVRHEIIWPDGRPHAIVQRLGRRAPFVREVRQPRVPKYERPQLRLLDGGRNGRKLDNR
jgi:hypothetical protein